MTYHTIKVRFEDTICFLQFHRPEANNTINDQLIEECNHVLKACEGAITILVLEGLSEVFCFGADFHGMAEAPENDANNPEPLYNLWSKLATGPYVTVAHVRGKANAGGIGFVAACDIVLADQTATFSLSELLFGLMPACVLPFLIRRTGLQKAHYMTLITQPISVQQAHSWGLVDAYDDQSANLLRNHLRRLRCLSKPGISRYKRYMSELYGSLTSSKSAALAANKAIFSDQRNLQGIVRYIKTGQFPWEK